MTTEPLAVHIADIDLVVGGVINVVGVGLIEVLNGIGIVAGIVALHCHR